MPELELALPDGRKLARIGNLMLVPQESTLVVGPSGAGKSTLVPRHRGAMAVRQGRDLCSRPHAKLMLLPQRPYIPIGPAARRDRLSVAAERAFPTTNCADGAVARSVLPRWSSGSTRATTGRCACPAANSSAWRSRARCSPSRIGCSSTRRLRRSTSRARPTSIATIARHAAEGRRWFRSATARRSSPSTSAASHCGAGGAPATLAGGGSA